jgi:hypothetical protein
LIEPREIRSGEIFERVGLHEDVAAVVGLGLAVDAGNDETGHLQPARRAAGSAIEIPSAFMPEDPHLHPRERPASLISLSAAESPPSSTRPFPKRRNSRRRAAWGDKCRPRVERPVASSRSLQDGRFGGGGPRRLLGALRAIHIGLSRRPAPLTAALAGFCSLTDRGGAFRPSGALVLAIVCARRFLRRALAPGAAFRRRNVTRFVQPASIASRVQDGLSETRFETALVRGLTVSRFVSDADPPGCDH